MVDETPFTSHTGIAWQGGDVGVVQYGSDANMICMFYNRPTHHPGKSQEAGRPVFEDVPFVKIHPPGERLNIVDRPAIGNDARRFPTQWQQFQNSQKQIPDGTPIDLLYPEKPSVAAVLRANHVYTIEQCSQLSGPAIDNIGMGAQDYANAAKQYLEAAQKGVHASTLRHELEGRDSQIRVLSQQVEALKQQLSQIGAQQNAGISPEQLQAIIAGAMGRPVFPAQPVAGTPQLDPQFDAQTAQINANSPTAEVLRQKLPNRRRKAVA